MAEESTSELPSVADLVSALVPVAAEWETLGRKLKLEEWRLKNTAGDHPLGDDGACEKRLSAVLRHWRNNATNGSWSDILRALREMGESVLAQSIEQKHCTASEEYTTSTDSGDYMTTSDEDYATADEDRASDSSPETSEGSVLLVTQHSSSISPGIAATSTTPSHQPPPSLSSSQPQEAQPHSHQAQASFLLVPQVQPQGSHQLLPSIPSLQVQEAQSLSPQTALLSQTLQSSSISAGPPGDSPEVTALCQHSAELVKAISASDLAWKLLAKRLIELDITKYCQLPAVISDEKSSKIVCAVIETVSASPHLFESLVSVLSESGNTALMSGGEKLKQTYELILKEKLADSSKVHEVQPPPPPSQPQSPELCLYAKYLRAVYTRSKLPIYSKWPPSPGKRFINLAIISKEGITREEADKFTKATLHGDLEEILKIKVPVKLEEILQTNPDEELKCILIEGAPGVGKTTLSWKVCHRWGKGELYQEYSIVVLLRLRDQNVQRAGRVADLFYYPDEETQKKIAKDTVNSQGSGILIILEGLDELPSHLISESSIFARLLSGTELPHATILVTSRPSATYKLWENWKEHISRHIEILGFTDDNITEYAQSVLPVDEQQKFEDYLSLHPYIRSMLYIPLHCAIVTAIYMECQKTDRPLPKTITELYAYLTQAILIRYLKSHSEYKDKNYTLDTLSNLPSPVYAHFLSLCQLAFNGVNDQKQIFHSLSTPLEHLGFMDTISELFVHQQSATYSYNFLHLSVQEYLAAYHVSLMSHDKQEQLLQSNINCYDHRSNMIRFLAGITKFKDQNKVIVKEVIGIEDLLSMYALELLYECQDVSILDSEDKLYTVYISTDSLHKLHSLGYCIANSRSKWELKFKHKSNIGADIICHSLKKAPLSNSFITGISFESCSPEFTYQLLMLLPEYMLPHIESLIIMSADTQSLPPQVIPRMERLKALTLETITIDTSQPELILDLSRIPTLRNLRIQSDCGKFEILLLTDSLPSINASCTPKLVGMILSQLSQQTIANIGSLTVTYSYSQEGPQLLPPCLPELIPNMEKLNTLTLKNVLDTSLTELIPALSRVHTLRNLRIKSNSGKFEMLSLTDSLPSTGTINASNCTPKLVDMILPQLPQQTIAHIGSLTVTYSYSQEGPQPLPPCLPELIPNMEKLNTLILENVLDTSLTKLLPALSRVHALRYLKIQSDSGNFEMLFPTDSLSSTGTIIASCIPKLVDMILSQLPQQTIAHIGSLTVTYSYSQEGPQPLPPCLPGPIPNMKKLNRLTLENVLDTSLTDLIPVLSRVHTLRSLTLHKLNLEGITLLCEWLPTRQLKTLPLHEQTWALTTNKMIINFCNSSMESINCQYCTAEFIDQILTQLPQQSIIHVQAFTIWNDFGHYQQLPPCLPELIPRLEKLNTLTLKNVLDTSLTELLPALSRVHTLRNLRIQSDSGNFEMLFPTDSRSSTGTINASCTSKLVDMILPQLPQQTIAHIGSLTVTYSYSQEGPQPLPPCLPELIPKMKKLNTLTLENVLDTSLTELLPVLSRVHNLRSLTHKIITNFCNSSIESIDCQYCTAEFIDQILSQLPQQSIIHVQAFRICNDCDHYQQLPPCLPELIPRLEKLNTLTLKNVLDTSLTELLPALSRVHALRYLKIQSDSGNFEMLFPTDSLSSTGTIIASSIPKLVDMFLSQLPQQTIAHIGSLTVTYSYSQEGHQPLPPCLPRLIPNMEKLNRLTLENVLDTSLTDLIPVLSRVSILRNLTLHKLNSESITCLCEWLPTCQLKTLTLHEQAEALETHKIIINFCNSSIESIDCQYCTAEFIDQILSQLPQQSIIHVQAFTIWNEIQPLPSCLPELILKTERLSTLILENVLDTSLTELLPVLSRVHALRNLRIQSDSGNFEMLFPTDSLSSTGTINASCIPKLVDMILLQLPQQTIAQIGSLTVIYSSKEGPQPLPPCLSELILKMKRVNTLTLENVLDTSLTELLPALSRVHILRNLRIQSDSGNFEMLFSTDSLSSTGIINASCTPKLVDMILSQLPQQTIAHIGSLTVTYSYSKEGPQPLPPCLPGLIPKMEILNTLTLENVHNTSLTEFIPALSRIHTMRNLRIQSDSGNLQLLFCEVNQLCTISSIPKLFFPQLPQQCLAHIESLTMTCSYSLEGPQPLPPCLPGLIPKMERLDTLTLENVLCIVLTELIPLVFRVPSLRDLTLLKLNSEDSALLFQWLPTCQLEKLTLHQHTEGIVTPRITITFYNSSIEAIEWQDYTTELIGQFLSQIPQQSIMNIKTLKICNDQPQRLPALIQGMEQLNTLHCLHKLNSEGIAHLCQWLPTCQLETLTLHSLSPDHSVMVCKALTSVSSLKTLDIQDSNFMSMTLDIRGSKFMTFLSMQALVSLLQQNQSLTELALTYCNIDSDGAHCLAKALHHNTTLKRLVMLGNPVGERGALAMAEMFKHNSALEEFIGVNTNSGGAGISHLAEALHHNTTLRKLDMRGNSVGERGAYAIAEMFKHNTTLEELCLSHTNISSDGAGAMAEALHHNTTLKRLNMSGNPVGERGALAIAEMLKNNTTLEELNLFMAQIGCDGAVAMAEALHHNTTLRKLDMSGNPVGKEGALAIAEMLKHSTTLEEVDLRRYSVVFSDVISITALAESLAGNKNLKKLIVSSQYRDCVESLPVYQHIKGRVELR